MKHLVFAITGLALLGACSEYSQMYKVGTSSQQTNVDQAQCNTFAAQTVPPMIVTDWIPIFDANGRVVAQRVETYDVNEGRRHTAVRTCMEEKGYQRVNIPYCKDEQLAGRNYAPVTNSPALTPSICAIRQKGGGRVLVDLSKPL